MSRTAAILHEISADPFGISQGLNDTSESSDGNSEFREVVWEDPNGVSAKPRTDLADPGRKLADSRKEMAVPKRNPTLP